MAITTRTAEKAEKAVLALMTELGLNPDTDSLHIGHGEELWRVRMRQGNRQTGTASGNLVDALNEATQTLGIGGKQK